MDQQQYLDYIRALHDRLSKRSSQTGLTTWALLGALSYLLMQLPDLLSRVRAVEWQSLVLLGWAHLQVAADCGYLLAENFRGKNPPNRFNYRIRHITNISDVALAIVFCLLLFGVPAALSSSAAISSIGIPETERFVLAANKWAFGTFGVMLIAYLIAYFGSHYFSVYPSTLFLKRNTNLGASLLTLATVIGFAVLFVANFYFFCLPWLTTGQTTSSALATIQIVLVFIVIIIRILLSSLPRQRSLEWLEDLERDIVVHHISESEIKDRLEREYLGHELGALLKQRVDEVRIRADELQRIASERSVSMTLGHRVALI